MSQDKKTQARIPADVHQWLTGRAKQNDRSMNSELVRILKAAKEADEKKAQVA